MSAIVNLIYKSNENKYIAIQPSLYVSRVGEQLWHNMYYWIHKGSIFMEIMSAVIEQLRLLYCLPSFPPFPSNFVGKS